MGDSGSHQLFPVTARDKAASDNGDSTQFPGGSSEDLFVVRVGKDEENDLVVGSESRRLFKVPIDDPRQSRRLGHGHLMPEPASQTPELINLDQMSRMYRTSKPAESGGPSRGP
jgi:hypothetical protein